MAGVASDQSGHILHNILLFGHLLRRLGLNVHEGRMVDAVRVLEDIGMTRRRGRAVGSAHSPGSPQG